MNCCELLNQLEACSRALEEYTALTRKKIELIVQNRPQQLDELLLQEQAQVMKVKSAEAKRLRLFQKSGLDGCTLKQFCAQCPDGYAPQAAALALAITSSAKEIRANNACIRDLLELKLHKLQSLIHTAEVHGLSVDA